MKTRITELFGIEHPIMLGGMMHVGRAELATAVSNAGGLGTITGLTQPTPEDLRREIARCFDMTDKPFAVNLTVLPTIKPVPYDEYVAAIIDGGVKIVETAGRSPEPFMASFKAAGVMVVHKCTSVRHALKAQKLGVDAVSVDGFECAGHPGEDDIPNLILLPRAAAALDIPFLASGGIGTGSQMAAALALGADAINMGTRFMCTKEAPIHDNMKQKIVESSELDTALIFRSLKNTARVFKNTVAAKVLEVERQPGDTDFSDIADMVSGIKGRAAMDGGNLEEGIWTAGLVTGLIDTIPTCEELINNLMDDCTQVIEGRLQGFVAA
ncbi:MAG: nitronate monooxygenase family protein [Halioglobus sp.]